MDETFRLGLEEYKLLCITSMRSSGDYEKCQGTSLEGFYAEGHWDKNRLLFQLSVISNPGGNADTAKIAVVG